jgi:hypothetical protein
MIGILLALQVNNFNEARKKQELIKSQLINLHASLRSVSIMWNRTVEVNEFRASSFKYLLEWADQSIENLTDLQRHKALLYGKAPILTVWISFLFRKALVCLQKALITSL